MEVLTAKAGSSVAPCNSVRLFFLFAVTNVKTLLARKARRADENETLPVDTKPRTSHL